MFNLSSEEQATIRSLLLEKGFKNSDDIISTRTDVGGNGKITMLQMVDVAQTSEPLFILYFKSGSPGAWEFAGVDASYTLPTSLNQEGVHHIGKRFHKDENGIPDRASMDREIMRQVRFQQIDDNLFVDKNIRAEFAAIGVPEYQQLLNKRSRYENFTYLRTKRELRVFDQEAFRKGNQFFSHAHFEFVLTSPTVDASPFIAFAKASLRGSHSALDDHLPKVEKVFLRGERGIPDLHQMTRELSGNLKIKVLDPEKILKLFYDQRPRKRNARKTIRSQ